jgi:DNA-binding NarL/FixJ family response regulator
MVEGLHNPEIAEWLAVSRSTVKFHVGGILSRLGGSRTGAVALVVQHNLAPCSP